MSEEREEAARRYRDAAEAYLNGHRVEAAGVFKRELASAHPAYAAVTRLYERLKRPGSVSRLPEKFLLAVAQNKVYAFSYSDWFSRLRIRSEAAVFDRDKIHLRSTPGGDVVYLRGAEKGRAREIPLDGTHPDKNPGAAEAVAALSE